MNMETYILDASKEPLGRLATKAAVYLTGKNRPDFERHRKHPVLVVVTNSDRIRLSGRKWSGKRYYRHSGYLGHLKDFSAAEMRARDSRKMIRLAVMGMLPKNRLRNVLIKNLAVYKDDPVAHP